MAEHRMQDIPERLEKPPHIAPPVQTRPQDLPFERITWENFEKLCLRLARLESDVVGCQLYGKRGESQEGIDLFARTTTSDKYTVYQCKNEENFQPRRIEAAVSEFLKGEWREESDMFVLCTRESLRRKTRADKVKELEKKLKREGVTFVRWDRDELSRKLKDLPALVDDFFGRAWVEAFCETDAVARLGSRVDGVTLTELRERLKNFYRTVFADHDPGLPALSLELQLCLPLEERFVVPDVELKQSVIRPQSEQSVGLPSNVEKPPFRGDLDVSTSGRRQRLSAREPWLNSVTGRHNVIDWLRSGNRSIILGEPGAGKSALLRFIASSLLEDSSQAPLLTRKWGEHIPVWVPFAHWVDLTSKSCETPSLTDILKKWFHSFDQDELYRLVELALEDERLLLLIDGLDEWTSEPAARVALSQLQVFVDVRNTPAVITSRPLGFRRLQMTEAGWQRAKLANFSMEQQKILAKRWFLVRHQCLMTQVPDDGTNTERKETSEAEGFLREINQSPELRIMAGKPLLLCLLLCLRFQRVHLPRNRFKVFGTIIDHLLEIHPKSRRKAALVTDELTEFDANDLSKVFSHLAFEVQSNFGEGIVRGEEAESIISNRLEDSESDFGFDQREARRHAKRLLEMASNTFGILVNVSPDALGFFHRALQEYLAGCHISRLSKKDQREFINVKGIDPQWREVVLALFHETKRSDDVAEFVHLIRSRLSNAAHKYSIESLLAEIAFGDFNCPARIVSELAENVFAEIEIGEWMPQRERLIDLALGGLRRPQLKARIQEKIKRWFPCRSDWRQGIYAAMASWPATKEVVDCLLMGIRDEHVRNQRAAAKALAELTSGDSQVVDQLVQIASRAMNPQACAAATEALIVGWPECEELEAILDAASFSPSPELRLVSMMGRIQRGIQGLNDWEELLSLGAFGSGVDHNWREEVGRALCRGWPGSAELKRRCLDALSRRFASGREAQDDVLFQVLLEGFPRDEDVAQCLASNFKRLMRAGIPHRSRLFESVFQDFPESTVLSDAIREFVHNEEYCEYETFLAAKHGHLMNPKTSLMALLGKRGSQDSAQLLLDRWGMEDKEVELSLQELAFSSSDPASSICRLLPRIIQDEQECKERLFEILKDAGCFFPDRVVEGLQQLQNVCTQEEIVDAALELELYSQGWKSDDLRATLIRQYPHDDRIRPIALSELSRRQGLYAAVAEVYGEDEEIKQKILRICNVLPTSLRLVIATELSFSSPDPEYSIAVLKDYDLEQDPQVKSQASIGYHRLLKQLGKDVDPAIQRLGQGVVARGFDFQERSQAALCGLLELDRLDVMVAAKSNGEDAAEANVYTVFALKPNAILLKQLVQNWDKIEAAFGNATASRLGCTNELEFWEFACPFVADTSGAASRRIHELLADNRPTPEGSNLLHFLSRTKPKSRLLLEACMATLFEAKRHKRGSQVEDFVAAEILGEHFGGDPEVLQAIMSHYVDPQISEQVILALCEGWSGSSELELLSQRVKKVQPWLSRATAWTLICAKSSAEYVFKTLTMLLSKYDGSYKYWSRWYVRPLVRRLRGDEELLAMMLTRLNQGPDPSEKASLPRLMSMSTGLSSELKNWCRREIDQQLNQAFPGISFDFVAGELRPVAHALLDVIYPLEAGDDRQAW